MYKETTQAQITEQMGRICPNVAYNCWSHCVGLACTVCAVVCKSTSLCVSQLIQNLPIHKSVIL